MKITCPKCRRVVQAPDAWAGRKAKCPSCKKMIRLPSPDEQDSGQPVLDLASLHQLEQGGEPVLVDRKKKPLTLKEAQRLAAAEDGDSIAVVPGDPSVRVCPRCHEKVKSVDPYAEMLCPHCGAGIPPPVLPSTEKVKYRTDYDAAAKQVRFYDGFMSAVTFPLPNFTAVLLGMLAALATIAGPILALLGVIKAGDLNPVAAKEGTVDYGWVGLFITAMFALQAVYFGALAYGVLIDTIRNTLSGNDAPPNLTWNITKLGTALGGYAGVLAAYLLAASLLVMMTSGAFPASLEELNALLEPQTIVLLIVLGFPLPMNLMGLASSNAVNGLHPARVGKSLWNTLGHYFFLYLIFLLYVGFYLAAMVGVLRVAGPGILRAAREGIGAGVAGMMGGLGAWSGVIGLGIYFGYVVGRILGLFARSYRDRLDFAEE